MEVLKNWLGTIAARWAVLNRPAALAVIALAVLSTAGAVWLVASVDSPEMVAVFDEPLGQTELSAARALLESREIPHRTENGKLFAPRKRAGRVRALLAQEGVGRRDLTGVFEQLTRESDLWSSQAQNDKRWQAAKMAVLSRQIALFPAVRSATVLYEGGSNRRLGSPAVCPTAAVQVSMQSGAVMSDRLVAAVADLVAGSIAGMNPRQVRIVDDSGRSYRLGEEDPAAVAALARLARRDVTEAYYAEKIRRALAYIDNVMVDVRVETAGERTRCVGASVAVPRSYLLAVQGIGQAPAGEAKSNVAVQLDKIRHAVAHAIGAPETASVQVDWYFDVPSAPADARVSAGPSAAARPDGRWLASASVGLLAIGAACGTWLFLRRRRAAKAKTYPLAAAAMAATGGAFRAQENPPVAQSAVEAPGDDEPMQRRTPAFENISDVPAAQLAPALAALESDELAIALRTASARLKKKVLSALPAAAGRRVREEMECIGPVRLGDVESAQQRVLEVLRRSGRGRYVSAERKNEATAVERSL